VLHPQNGDRMVTIGYVTSLTLCIDSRRPSQLITLTVHLRLQHDARAACEAARRAGPSATADTCLIRRIPAVSFTGCKCDRFSRH